MGEKKDSFRFSVQFNAGHPGLQHDVRRLGRSPLALERVDQLVCDQHRVVLGRAFGASATSRG